MKQNGSRLDDRAAVGVVMSQSWFIAGCLVHPALEPNHLFDMELCSKICDGCRTCPIGMVLVCADEAGGLRLGRPDGVVERHVAGSCPLTCR